MHSLLMRAHFIRPSHLQSLTRPNVHLAFDHVTPVEPDGVVIEAGICLFFDLGAGYHDSHCCLGEKTLSMF